MLAAMFAVGFCHSLGMCRLGECTGQHWRSMSMVRQCLCVHCHGVHMRKLWHNRCRDSCRGIDQ